MDENTKLFINKSKNVHGDKYDYSLSVYVDSCSKIKIKCSIHGIFEQKPSNHLQGCGCIKCSIMKRKYTTDEFIIKANEKHNGKYDYSKIKYENCYEPIIIICNKHGEFNQKPYYHLNGGNCPKCLTVRQLSMEEWLIEAKKIHGNKYDYTDVKYVGACKKISIICKIHGSFLQLARSHLMGKKCPSCCNNNNIRLTTEKFIDKAIHVHGNKYDYSKVNYVNYHTKITIICKKHEEFIQIPSNHLKGSNCPKCVRTYSPSINEWIQKAREVHGDRYDYSKVKYIDSKTNVIIICKKHGEFQQSPCNHLGGSNCKTCVKQGFSKKAIQWLEYISYKENLMIQHVGNLGEFLIPGTRMRADGFCKKTNTIYEFNGCFFHGCPSCHNLTDVNPISKKKYGKLLSLTKIRENLLKDKGFNIISIWEHEWNEIYKKNQDIILDIVNKRKYAMCLLNKSVELNIIKRNEFSDIQKLIMNEPLYNVKVLIIQLIESGYFKFQINLELIHKKLLLNKEINEFVIKYLN